MKKAAIKSTRNNDGWIAYNDKGQTIAFTAANGGSNLDRMIARLESQGYTVTIA